MTTEIMTPPDEAPNRGGAPRGNKNNTRHGLRASSLPKGCSYLQGQIQSFRADIRDELRVRLGKVSLYHETILQSACRHETRALLVSRWIRTEGDKLTIDQRSGLLRDLSNATDARDRCLKLLGLDRDAAQDAVSALYGPSREVFDPPDEPPGEPPDADSAGPSSEPPRAEIVQPEGSGETTGDSGGSELSAEILRPDGGTDQ